MKDHSNSHLPGHDFSAYHLVNANFTKANLTRANFSVADLDRVSFCKAKLKYARFYGASIEGTDFNGAVGVIDLGTPCGYRAIAVDHGAKGLMIKAGCHWFTLQEAREYWHGKPHRAEAVLALAYAEAVARERRWTVYPKRKTVKLKRKAAKKARR